MGGWEEIGMKEVAMPSPEIVSGADGLADSYVLP
jgi:hypothetical protein